MSLTSPYTSFLAELRRYDVKLTHSEMTTLTAAADARLFGDDEAAVTAGEALLAELATTRFEQSAVAILSELLAAIEPVAALATA